MGSVKITVYVLLLFSFIKCGEKTKEKIVSQKETKINISRDSDLYVIPLLDDIRVISTNGVGSDWTLDLPYGNLINKKTIGVDSLSVFDEYILVYTESTYLPGEMTEAWVLINTKKKSEFIYKDFELLKKQSLEISKREYEMNEVNDIFVKIQSSNKLPW
ncbi:hypothetical protein LY01_03010 [Nonlabens xylanidelens]|uniref:Uncharacterized protein n=1 Tax=Nonlabens xylanidelens TaxID=191564 RepID=A0A2S6IDF6_9FLAO|nr:hypothetical protein [Nonlabens xylanidelens]PPK92252.1 hypothetical protein LY01_03010 [Nonlabens xylanidelens]PQJ18921.1 hypothetical protein BST94_06800 [Nonlabens xylanidelens]PQJ19517.1 hypothetical protein BST94_06745 [Nonlabens xylanidelens]PQJ23584.1 hypothetical protein BST94_00035 [Nonlabens xylanidelens]